MKNCKYIHGYIEKIKSGKVKHCIDQDLMIDNIVLPVLERDDIYIDEEKIEKGLELQKYFPFKLIEWEVFLFALIAGVFLKSGEIFFTDVKIFIGRGNGKNGFVSFLSFYFLSPVHGINGYDIEILANSEDQSKTSFNDLYMVINNPKDKRAAKALSDNFKATKTEIIGLRTNSTMKFNSASSRGKDSKRTGCVIVDEEHEYLTDINISTLTSGLGKVPNGRVITISTDGLVRGGVLDADKDQCADILKEYNPENRTLVFWCRTESDDEWKDESNWIKANPSIDDFPSLKTQIRNEVKKLKYTPSYFPTFMAKRMNRPVGNKDEEVASWEDIKSTNQPVIDLTGMTCVVGIDFAKTNDFVAACALFRKDDVRYIIPHGWVCSKSKDLIGIKAPLDEWAQKGLITFVNDVEIPAELIAEWVADINTDYVVEQVAVDSFRFSFLNFALKGVGFDAYELKNVKLIRPSDIMKAAINVNSAFINHQIACGDNPYFRWNVNNAKLITDSRGNISYGKIEPTYRKTDAFMAFVNAMCIEDALPYEADIEIFEPLLF